MLRDQSLDDSREGLFVAVETSDHRVEHRRASRRSKSNGWPAFYATSAMKLSCARPLPVNSIEFPEEMRRAASEVGRGSIFQIALCAFTIRRRGSVRDG
jgi:hypothetical protein